jgi:hypothetical protein
MLSWVRRWPAHVLNGVTVSVGVGLVSLLAGAAVDAELAAGARMGAVFASLPHLTGRALPTLRRTLVGGLFASLATLAMLALSGEPALRGLVLAVLAFLALLAMAWGPRAGPLAFSVIIAIVFALAPPRSSSALAVAGASVCGVFAYSLWAVLSAKLLEGRYRVLAVANALDAAGALLRARAAVLSVSHREEDGPDVARFEQLNDEVRLAQALQAARDLVFPALRLPAASRKAAILARLSELREIVLTSRLDLDTLGDDSRARFTRARLAVALARLGDVLRALATAVREGRETELAGREWPPQLPDMMEAATLLAGDQRARLVPVIATRLRYLQEEVAALRALVLGQLERTSLNPEELVQYIDDDDTWPLHVVVEHLSLSSPVFRHALRSGLALGTVYFMAHALPWATRPYWMLLSVAVVLRGTLDDTLSRRNARVLGTAIGCVLIAVVVPIASEPLLQLLFVAAVGAAHAFVNVRYLVTAIAATLMALLQAHFSAPTTAFLVAERLLDTVIGALLAWAFSYVLPSWERRTLPVSIERMLQALRQYSERALMLGAARADQRLARQRAYDALSVVSAAIKRSAAEPERVRPPVRALVEALDHGQRLMAHLSSVRSLLGRRAALLPPDATLSALEQARLSIDARLSPSSGLQVPRTLPLPEPPGSPIEQTPLPWLLRRLEASVHEAGLAGDAARSARVALLWRQSAAR